MKFSALAASLCSLAAFSSANLDEKRAFNVALTFYGVDGSSYGEIFPADTTSVRIDNPTVVKSIWSNRGGFCTIIGADGSSVVIAGEGNYTVNPPQVQVRGVCDNL
ncbi:uncharacterized protein EURHEDRAFT_404496 [Aspergillus ruber CBS 135680]|uniref:Uncharacterized protein n=1 Tax=Aspergillus ruber (strain CBS 135680) TaxID=1388766 RepID=A0A017S8K8_ASPRC|nr:uncharacterized protein EURHEDRAFT_404496 [Aspergillus ruber CBS 135680]EYE93388.1 hypothetical protein EURHEDRAFT_404496 [Aspergillus ruber CBS 135680]